MRIIEVLSMSKKQSRKERKKQEKKINKKQQSVKKTGISKIYYYIIGFLFLILLLLIIFIFSRGGNKIKLEDEQKNESALVDNNESDNDIQTDKEDENITEETEESEESEEPGETEEAEEADDEKEDSLEEDTDEENQDTEELEPGDSTVVNEEAPHDTDHAVDYNDGSADRVAIKNEVMAATGLSDDLIEWWVGNDGAGRVEATVSNREQTEIYQVHLQYGDGNWHVLNYERINSIPNN